ncbi:MAG: LemA family protein, partial [Bacilli bacterium]|nr:LemA family protein [Bacilli bacterium]
ENIIDTDLRGKYDLLIKINTYFTNLENKNQKDYLKDLKDLKGKDIPNFELERKLMDAEGILLDIYNDKSENQENKELQVLLKELKEKNQKLLSSINYYNNYASQMNAYIRKIPQNLVDILSHKKEKEFFDKKESKKITSSH